MENRRTVEIRVGIFVAIGLLMTITSIFLLGGDRVLFTSYMDLKVHFKEVQGLAPGSVVSLRGVVIGNIDQIKFDETTKELIAILKVESSYNPMLTEGSTAEIKTQGALGDKIVYVTPGPASSKPLPDGGTLLALEGTDLMSVITSRGEGVTRVFDIINELYALVKSINSEGRVSTILNHLSTASGKLTDTLTQTQTMIEEMRRIIPKDDQLSKSLTHLNSILSKVDSGKGTLGALINDPAIHSQLQSFLGTSSQSKYLKGVLRSTIQESKK